MSRINGIVEAYLVSQGSQQEAEQWLEQFGEESSTLLGMCELLVINQSPQIQMIMKVSPALTLLASAKLGMRLAFTLLASKETQERWISEAREEIVEAVHSLNNQPGDDLDSEKLAQFRRAAKNLLGEDVLDEMLLSRAIR